MPKDIAGVPKTFDDQLEAFVAFLKANKISGIGIDAKQLEADLKDQRTEKQADLDAERSYRTIHRAFLEHQTERYARYMTAVNVVRAANRGNQSALKALAQFKRPSKPAAKPTTGNSKPKVK